ncbi:MAG: transglycosylase SLT domain-containing protein [Pseudomonadota bacterium]
MMRLFVAMLGAALLNACAEEPEVPETLTRETLPEMRWSHVDGKDRWNAAALAALEGHGKPLVDTVPRDIDAWCPAYRDGTEAQRKAFWIGFMSALAKHESTYRPAVVSSNGKWFGLLQISPATARGYNCRADSGADLKVGGENLSCAVRIMAVTVPRDGVIADNDGRWRGVAADWGPLRVASKRKDIAGWLKQQPFCADGS